MKKILLLTAFLCSSVLLVSAQDSLLIKEWQLTHFDGIDKMRASQAYRTAVPSMREDIEMKIKARLENTVYNFISMDSLYFTDNVDYQVVQKRVRIEISEDQVLSIFDGPQVKKAKIIELSPERLVLEPILEGGQVGRMIFEPYFKKED
ncbi:hypothetical protein [Algoriphagus sp. CAU 1675]|uniref:hypothetical protein n=1 Tax=Algoriphagus sp. CAU 1675 TaxID=3032597 RepID=UPI0023DA218D|nr:hypothetical protein [Algoriphagus sp. CAU 1675]MDF2157185.1 hypothetical protein [Algoriphagus sp. CAU 1675]